MAGCWHACLQITRGKILNTAQCKISQQHQLIYPLRFLFPHLLKRVWRIPKTKLSKMGDIPKSASDRANLAMKKMEEIYQCPVCLRLPICNIYQCKEGHLVCVDCYKRLPSPQPVCPTCRTALPNPPIRCRSAEQVNLLYVHKLQLNHLYLQFLYF